MGIKEKQHSLPKLNPAFVQHTFSEEPGVVLTGMLPFRVELLSVLCSVNVLNTFSFSKSSRTEK